jgi:DNA-binding SARP family transcriptional activator
MLNVPSHTAKTAFQVTLLGGHVFLLNGEDITLKIPHKGRALLAMLLMEPHPLLRKTVASQLWPDTQVQHALGSLRTLLTTLKKKLHLTNYFSTTYREIGRRSDAAIWCDAEVFQRQMKRILMQKPLDLPALRRTLDLYLGAFMLGFQALDAPVDHWIDRQRLTLEKLASRALTTIIEAYDAQNDPKTAVEYAYRLLEIDPWRESTTRQIMRLLARQDRVGAALHQFELCHELLQHDLGVHLEEATTQLAKQIRRHKIPVVQPFTMPSLPQQPAAPFLVPNMDTPLIGRTQVVARLQTAFVSRNGRLHYCLTGLGGMGKTAVAIHIANYNREQFRDGVLWADCASQTTVEIAAKWSKAVGYDLSHIIDSAARLAALRALLAPKQILLIFDDVQNAAHVRELIPNTENTAVLLTTRNVEIARLLQAQTIQLEQLTPENSRSLFVRILGEDRAEEDETAVQKICDQLHHLPLAIVIAANFLVERPYRYLSDFVRQLQNETERLTLTHANRQVQATFNISWTALHSQEKTWFGLLGLFKGRSFTADAFATISDLDVLEAEAQLKNFSNLSLLMVDKRGHFYQHPLLAAFAQEKLSHLKIS